MPALPLPTDFVNGAGISLSTSRKKWRIPGPWAGTARPWVALCAAAVVPGLLLSTLAAGPAAAGPVTARDTADRALAAAAERARRTHDTVPVPERTTESSTSAVTPEGEVVTELSAGPVRFRGPDGGWRDIDTRLNLSGGVLRPEAVRTDVQFSAGGDFSFARLRTSPGSELEFGWPSRLPEPRVRGHRATYERAVGGTGDLVVTALPSGVRFEVVLRARPTGPLKLEIPLVAAGRVDRRADGGLRLTDESGSRVTISPTASMRAQPATRPGKADGFVRAGEGTAREGAVAVRYEPGGNARTPANASGGAGGTLVLEPDRAFLDDPATVYPVTVAPTVTTPVEADTDVNSVFDWNNVGGQYLKAGTEADGEKSRTYLKFGLDGLPSATAAELRVPNVDAPACGAKVGAGIQVRRVTSTWDPATQTWARQPTSTTQDAALSTEGSTDGTCGTGLMTWNVTGIVGKWLSGAAPNHGMVLQSPTETASANYRVFTSAENTEAGSVPTLVVTTALPAGTCVGSGCTGIEPSGTTCASDAYTVKSVPAQGRTIELRYSPSCRAAWGRILGASVGDYVGVRNSAGAYYEDRVNTGTDQHTVMVGNDGLTSWACGWRDTVLLDCTSGHTPAAGA